jgi:hypothetical protein
MMRGMREMLGDKVFLSSKGVFLCSKSAFWCHQHRKMRNRKRARKARKCDQNGFLGTFLKIDSDRDFGVLGRFLITRFLSEG